MEDPHSTYNEIEAFTSLSRGTIYNIIHEHLKLRKVVARWVPHELTDEDRRKRVEDCCENLKMFRKGKRRLCDEVTGDESCFFYRQIGRKQDNATWIGEGKHAKSVVSRSQFEPNHGERILWINRPSPYSFFFKWRDYKCSKLY